MSGSEFPGIQSQVASNTFNFSSLRPPLPSFAANQFVGGKPDLGHHNSITSGVGAINPGLNNIQEARREACESPTARNTEEDVQKIQENNNNNQSDSGETNSEEVTPPKNQGLIKVIRNMTQKILKSNILHLHQLVN